MTGGRSETPAGSMPPSSGPPSLDELAEQHKEIAALLRSDELLRGEIGPALEKITEAATRLLQVRRASVWVLAEAGARIECVDMFDRESASHTRGAALDEQAAPAYFAALREARTVAAHDALGDARTRELGASYLAPLGITSLLDAPFFVQGELHGVLCHEHIGPRRRFLPHEQLIAGTLADLVGTATIAADRSAQSRELESLKDGLERLVEARTAELEASRAAQKRLFDASPVALVATRLGDQRVLFVNQRAAAMFEVGLHEAVGQLAPDFWVRAEDRRHLVQATRDTGRLENFEAELKTRSGKRFWASLSASVIAFEGDLALVVGVHDITATRRAAALLEDAALTLRHMLDAAPFPIVVSDFETGVVRFSNQRAADMLELPIGELVGREAPDFYVRREDRRALVDAVRAKGHVDGFSAELRSHAGRTFWALMGGRRMTLHGEDVLMVSLADLTEQKETEARLRDLSIRDALTGLFNRRHFFETGAQLRELSARHGWPLSVAIIDADDFKAVNDRYGHGVGDEALRAFARASKKHLRASDVLARYGGEELALLMPETDLTQAAQAAERLRAAVAAETFEAGAERLHLTVSVGVAEHADGETLEAMLQRADTALYRAKSAGKNRVERG